MMDRKSEQENIDPRLEELLSLLRPSPQRDSEAEARGMAIFVAELEALDNPLVLPTMAPRARELPFIHMLKEYFAMFTRRPALMGVFSIVLIFVFLFGGTGVTAFAAQSSLPGDALYPLKTRLEMAQASLEGDPGFRAQLYTEFAQRRLDEISELIETGRFEDIPEATTEFQSLIQMALAELRVLAQSEPERAIELNTEISRMISEFAEELFGMLAQVPDPIKANLQEAIPATHAGVGDANVNGGNTNEVNGNDTNINDDNGNDTNANDDNGNDTNINDDDGNDTNINDDNGNDANDDDGNNVNDDDNGNDANDNGDDDANSNDDNGNNANDDDDDDDRGNDNDGGSGSGRDDDGSSDSGGDHDGSGSDSGGDHDGGSSDSGSGHDGGSSDSDDDDD